jgi:hypothetical protein
LSNNSKKTTYLQSSMYKFFKSQRKCLDLLRLSTFYIFERRPAIYVLYLKCKNNYKVLYVGETASLMDRMYDLIVFNHTFSRGLLVKLLSIYLGKEIKWKDAKKILTENARLKGKVFKWLDKIFSNICIKYKYLDSGDEKLRKYLEQYIILKLKPLEPHKKSSQLDPRKLCRS